jgi:nucleotide-binding universal stress UspA family protein
MQSRGFHRILLATDGTPQAEAAAHLATALAESSGSQIRVVHCWSMEVHHRHGVWDVEMRGEAEKLIAEAVDRLRALALEADGELIDATSAHVGTAIAEAARKFDADLVVVGTRALSDLRSMFEHGVSNQVLTAVSCPVLLVREDSASALHEPSRVLLAIAGGSDIGPAVRAASAAASTAGSKVLVTHVAQAMFGAQGIAYVESEEEIQTTIETAAAMLRELGATTDTRVARPGPVARTLAQIASEWQADVIVIGSSRLGNLGSIVLGSVTHDLVRETRRPVLVAERS